MPLLNPNCYYCTWEMSTTLSTLLVGAGLNNAAPHHQAAPAVIVPAGSIAERGAGVLHPVDGGGGQVAGLRLGKASRVGTPRGERVSAPDAAPLARTRPPSCQLRRRAGGPLRGPTLAISSAFPKCFAPAICSLRQRHTAAGSHAPLRTPMAGYGARQPAASGGRGWTGGAHLYMTIMNA